MQKKRESQYFMKMIHATKLLGERQTRKWIPKYLQTVVSVGETRHHGNPLPWKPIDQCEHYRTQNNQTIKLLWTKMLILNLLRPLDTISKPTRNMGKGKGKQLDKSRMWEKSYRTTDPIFSTSQHQKKRKEKMVLNL